MKIITVLLASPRWQHVADLADGTVQSLSQAGNSTGSVSQVLRGLRVAQPGIRRKGLSEDFRHVRCHFRSGGTGIGISTPSYSPANSGGKSSHGSFGRLHPYGQTERRVLVASIQKLAHLDGYHLGRSVNWIFHPLMADPGPLPFRRTGADVPGFFPHPIVRYVRTVPLMPIIPVIFPASPRNHIALPTAPHHRQPRR